MRQITLGHIRTMAIEARGHIDMIFLHWSAGHYGQPFSDYHINDDRTNGGDIIRNKAKLYMENGVGA